MDAITTNKVNNNLPEDFYKSTNFYTLAGTAGAVWLLCIVIGSLDIHNNLEPLYYRIIALVFSMLISIIMTLKKTSIKTEYWLFAFFNGLLIFVNASGINAITSNSKFGYSNENNRTAAGINNSSLNLASIFPFELKNRNWWENNDLFLENKKLKKENESLLRSKMEIVNKQKVLLLRFKDSISNLSTEKTDTINANNVLKNTKDLLDSNKLLLDRLKNLQIQNKIKEDKLLELNRLIEKNKESGNLTPNNQELINELKKKISEKDKYIKELKNTIEVNKKYNITDLEICKQKLIECRENKNER
ncbi:hypothetical protein [Flavobacterium gyeonganense]|uniref:DUF4407 domain-containing protein n=1 Tax=Flavobacterium gyeonganense TaxID=1310418 RepID=A0ABV5H7C2_9FLAO|nr:hypothetical protein [Flavobacterium gyeonganense]